MWFLVFINQLISIGYGVNRGAAFAPKAKNQTSTDVFFYA